MIELLLAMGGILATWLLAGAAFIGIGHAVAGLFGAWGAPLTFTRAFWWGWAATVALLQAWHLFLPVDGRAAAVVLAAGLAGWLLVALRRYAVAFDRTSIGQSRLVYTVMAMTALFVANLALGTPENYDTGLYHMQAVRWNSQFPAVPGLGNLHGRLAFNNASLLYASLFDVGPWVGRSHHLATGLLALAVLLPMIAVGTRHLLFVLLLPATLLYSYKHVTSYSPDVVVFFLGVVITAELWESLADSGDDRGRRWQRLFGIVLLSAVGAVVKLSFLPMAVVAIGVACAADGVRKLSAWRKLIIALVPVTVLGLWVARGLILSGYPAYPQTWMAADVPWRVPIQQAQHDLDDVLAWARDRDASPEEALSGGHWVFAWAARQFRDVLKVTLPLIFFCAALFAGWRLRHNCAPRSFDRRWWALAPAAATILFVLATAPDLSRFAGASLWILAAGATTILLTDHSRGLVGRIVAMTAVVLLAISVVKAARYLNGPSDGGAFRPIPIARLAPSITESGLTVYAPYRLPEEEPHGWDQAWDAPLPSTPYFNPRLSLLKANDLGSGFAAPAAR